MKAPRRGTPPALCDVSSVRLVELLTSDFVAIVDFLIYEPGEGRSYHYELHNGLWYPTTEDMLRSEIAIDLIEVAPDELQNFVRQSDVDRWLQTRQVNPLPPEGGE